jgi:hypothetical protein
MNDQAQNQNPPAKKLLAAGIYDMLCTGEVQYGTSTAGFDEVAVQVEVEDRRLTAKMYFSPSSEAFSRAKLKACGYSGTGDIGPQIKGHVVKGSIKHDTYQDKTTGEMKVSMKVNIFDGEGGGVQVQKPMSDSQKANFLARLATPGAPPGPGGGYPPAWDAKTAPTVSNGGAPAAKTGSFSLPK